MQNMVAISALGVLSSKYFLSRVQYMAAARTLVGDLFSQLWKQSAAGSGRMCILQYLIMSCHLASVVTATGGSVGVVSGDVVPGGNTSWSVGLTAAVRIKVICSGVTSVAKSAMP